jgi:hypothetical protein
MEDFQQINQRIQNCLRILENNTELEDNIGITLPRLKRTNYIGKNLAIQLFPFSIDVEVNNNGVTQKETIVIDKHVSDLSDILFEKYDKSIFYSKTARRYGKEISKSKSICIY